MLIFISYDVSLYNLRTSGAHIPDDEIRQAEEKFAESLTLAQIGMFNLLDNDVSALQNENKYISRDMSNSNLFEMLVKLLI